MRLKILLPGTVYYDGEVLQVNAEAQNGCFSLLPAHIDFVTALVPGILSCKRADGSTGVFAVDEGILVKCGSEVMLSCRNAVAGESLESLHRTVREEYRNMSEHERIARLASARLEAGLIWKFLEQERV